ncbi:hypothetical protein AR688_17140 [Rheinheimera sp. EpRS3]|nr:hypothetical protein AR688_17140 [Rheinheimera sp. EpRS3]
MEKLRHNAGFSWPAWPVLSQMLLLDNAGGFHTWKNNQLIGFLLVLAGKPRSKKLLAAKQRQRLLVRQAQGIDGLLL